MKPVTKKINLPKALAHLRKDPKMAPLIAKYPKPTFNRQTSHGKPVDPFYALCESIIFQQLSGKAADTILGRFLKLFRAKHPTPKALLKLTDEEIRSTGVSGQKMSYLRDLANKFIDKTINEKGLEEWSDEEVRTHLIAVKGIGKWTADMFLMFYLQRPDILPTGDLIIQKNFGKLFKLRTLPSPEKMEKLSKPWQPYRTVASRYLWNLADDTK